MPQGNPENYAEISYVKGRRGWEGKGNRDGGKKNMGVYLLGSNMEFLQAK